MDDLSKMVERVVNYSDLEKVNTLVKEFVLVMNQQEVTPCEATLLVAAMARMICFQIDMEMGGLTRVIHELSQNCSFKTNNEPEPPTGFHSLIN